MAIVGLVIRQGSRPDATLAELAAPFKRPTATIDLWLTRLGWSCKKTLHAAEQSRPDVAEQRKQWPQRLAGVSATHLVFVDESGAHTQMTRRCGRSPIGQRLVCPVPHGHYQTTTMIARRAGLGWQEDPRPPRPAHPGPARGRCAAGPRRAEGHPFFAHAQSGHGRVNTWRGHAFELEAMRADFPFARSLIVVRRQRTIKKSGQSSEESRSSLSRRAAGEHTSAPWLGLIRGHWAGVENRNHWRRDAWMGADHRRSRHATLLANLASIRSALLQVLSPHLETQSLPQLQEHLHSKPARGLTILAHS